VASISLCMSEDARGFVEEDSADVDTIMRSLVRLVLSVAQAFKVPIIYLCSLDEMAFEPWLELWWDLSNAGI
jgi:hypothetical protein